MRFILMMAVLSHLAWAVQLTPMSQKITESRDKNVLFSVINGSNNMAASEFEVMRVVGHTKEGREIREETDALVVYPSQFIMKPKVSKKVRVSYKKRVLPTSQEIYRVIARELPLDVVEQTTNDGTVKAGVKFIFTYEGLLLVGGDQKDSKLEVQIKDSNSTTIFVAVKNAGKMSAVVASSQFDVVFKTSKETIRMDKSSIELFPTIRILPDETFVFRFKNIKKLRDNKLISVTLEPKN